jgi:hypothetical protein
MKCVSVKWVDSYGISSGWRDLSGYKAQLLNIVSLGFIVFEDEKVVALAHNYSEETPDTPEQANGIMVIPKVSIKEITDIYYRE